MIKISLIYNKLRKTFKRMMYLNKLVLNHLNFVWR